MPKSFNEFINFDFNCDPVSKLKSVCSTLHLADKQIKLIKYNIYNCIGIVRRCKQKVPPVGPPEIRLGDEVEVVITLIKYTKIKVYLINGYNKNSALV